MKENRPKNRMWEYGDILKEYDNIFRGIARGMGLSECSFWVLYTLRTDIVEPVQSEICACLYESKQTVNSALKKMEAEGLLELTSGKDRRSKRILLTAAGISLCERTVDRVIERERRALEDLTEEEQDQFLALFRKFNGLLKAHMAGVSEMQDARHPAGGGTERGFLPAP